jgi:hypothetical protein
MALVDGRMGQWGDEFDYLGIALQADMQHN